MFLDFGFSLRN